MTPGVAADSICAIIRNSGDDGKTMMRGDLWTFFERKHDDASLEDFAEGLNLPLSEGRLKANDIQVWLVKEGP
jgi:hypothetical protein